MQVDVLIDETYAVFPAGYYLTDFLASYNLTLADVANYSWGGAMPKVILLPVSGNHGVRDLLRHRYHACLFDMRDMRGFFTWYATASCLLVHAGTL